MPNRDSFKHPSRILDNLEEAKTRVVNDPHAVRWAVCVIITSLIEYIRYNENK